MYALHSSPGHVHGCGRVHTEHFLYWNLLFPSHRHMKSLEPNNRSFVNRYSFQLLCWSVTILRTPVQMICVNQKTWLNICINVESSTHSLCFYVTIYSSNILHFYTQINFLNNIYYQNPLPHTTRKVFTFLMCFSKNLHLCLVVSLKYHYPQECDGNLPGYGKGEFCLH